MSKEIDPDNQPDNIFLAEPLDDDECFNHRRGFLATYDLLALAPVSRFHALSMPTWARLQFFSDDRDNTDEV